MPENTIWESIKAEGSQLLESLKKVIHEGNVRRIVVKQGNRTVAEFPLSVGVVGTVVAPVLAAVGAVVALVQDCSIEVEREAPESVIALLAALGYQAYQFVGNTPVPYASGDPLPCPNMLFMYADSRAHTLP